MSASAAVAFPEREPDHTQPGLAQAVADTGLACIVTLARFHAIRADAGQIAHEFAHGGEPLVVTQILLASKKIGLLAKCARPARARLATTPLPPLHAGWMAAFSASHESRGCQPNVKS